jgi:FkbM family methyltransferase
MFYSQSEQDKWVCENTNYKKNGYFLDIGAYDGIQTSNSYYLEKELNWNGICVEANPDIFNILKNNRKSININCAVSDHIGECYFNNDKITNNPNHIKVNTLDLYTLLKEYNSPKYIDYLSIDIEGHEVNVFNKFFEKNENFYTFGYLTVEHNLYCDGPENKEKIYEILTNNGYERVVDNALCKDKNPLYFNKPYEDWYKLKEDVKN